MRRRDGFITSRYDQGQPLGAEHEPDLDQVSGDAGSRRQRNAGQTPDDPVANRQVAAQVDMGRVDGPHQSDRFPEQPGDGAMTEDSRIDEQRSGGQDAARVWRVP